MTLPASGSISISQIAAEFGVSLPCVFPDNFYGKPGVAASGPLSISDFYGLSNASFDPDGGPQEATGDTSAFIELTCSVAAVWSYSGGGFGSGVSLSSGASGTSITFFLNNPTKTPRSAAWTATGTANGVTRNFTIALTANGDPF